MSLVGFVMFSSVLLWTGFDGVRKTLTFDECIVMTDLSSRAASASFLIRSSPSVSYQMTWLPKDQHFAGRRAFFVSARNGRRTLFELGLVPWTSRDSKENIATYLVTGGVFESKLYKGSDYIIYNTTSQYWPRSGSDRWAIVLIVDSSWVGAEEYARQVFSLFGARMGIE